MSTPGPFLDDLATCLRFYTRLPTPTPDRQDLARFAEALRVLPLAGAMIGVVGGVAFLCARALGLSVSLAAAFAVLALVLSTGGLHEDGLADVADGFGGGATPTRKLEIMRDSRVGAFGALALGFTLLLRVLAIGALGERSAWLAVAALTAAGAVSRVLGLLPLLLSPPARMDGAGAAMTRPTPSALRQASALACAFAALPFFAGVSAPQAVAANLAAFVGVLAFTRLAQQQIGGYSGDVLGAAQQVAEIAILAGLSAR